MIQSFSDIITNSSSEVFIIDTKDHSKVVEFLRDVSEIMGFNIYELVDFESCTKDNSFWYKGPKAKKGNLVIREKWDNSLPDMIRSLIKNMDGYNRGFLPEVKRVELIHLG